MVDSTNLVLTRLVGEPCSRLDSNVTASMSVIPKEIQDTFIGKSLVNSARTFQRIERWQKYHATGSVLYM